MDLYNEKIERELTSLETEADKWFEKSLAIQNSMQSFYLGESSKLLFNHIDIGIKACTTFFTISFTALLATLNIDVKYFKDIKLAVTWALLMTFASLIGLLVLFRQRTLLVDKFNKQFESLLERNQQIVEKSAGPLQRKIENLKNLLKKDSEN